MRRWLTRLFIAYHLVAIPLVTWWVLATPEGSEWATTVSACIL